MEPSNCAGSPVTARARWLHSSIFNSADMIRHMSGMISRKPRSGSIEEGKEPFIIEKYQEMQ
jgi:hypothetical protein